MRVKIVKGPDGQTRFETSTGELIENLWIKTWARANLDGKPVDASAIVGEYVCLTMNDDVPNDGQNWSE